MATETHNYQKLIGILCITSPSSVLLLICSNVLSPSLPTRDQPTVLSQQHCKYPCTLLACRLPLSVVLSEQEWVDDDKKLLFCVLLFHDKASKAWLGVIIFPDAMHTRRGNQAITMLHCNVSIMLLIEITSQPPTPPQHTRNMLGLSILLLACTSQAAQHFRYFPQIQGRSDHIQIPSKVKVRMMMRRRRVEFLYK